MRKKISKYEDYFLNNPKKYWFKRKIFGWGWTPVRWQGWIFLLVWIWLFIEIILLVKGSYDSYSDNILRIIVPFILMIIILFFVCYGTGEKPKWSWGIKS